MTFASSICSPILTWLNAGTVSWPSYARLCTWATILGHTAIGTQARRTLAETNTPCVAVELTMQSELDTAYFHPVYHVSIRRWLHRRFREAKGPHVTSTQSLHYTLRDHIMCKARGQLGACSQPLHSCAFSHSFLLHVPRLKP